MTLASHQLDAFLAVARCRHFTQAAKQLAITQSALSQRISALESELGVTLLVRDREGARLTAQGEILLRYTEVKESLESELLAEISGDSNEVFSGTIRIGGYSSILRSVVMPALAPFLRQSPDVHIETIGREMRELPSMLVRGEIQFMFLDSHFQRAGVESIEVGKERNVLIESTKYRSRQDYYLDHDPDDSTTDLFFRSQRKGLREKYRRGFMDDVYGILEGARLGYGRAVMSQHLLKGVSGIRVLGQYRGLEFPVVLHYHSQPYYSRLHLAVREILTQDCRQYLDP